MCSVWIIQNELLRDMRWNVETCGLSVKRDVFSFLGSLLVCWEMSPQTRLFWNRYVSFETEMSLLRQTCLFWDRHETCKGRDVSKKTQKRDISVSKETCLFILRHLSKDTSLLRQTRLFWDRDVSFQTESRRETCKARDVSKETSFLERDISVWKETSFAFHVPMWDMLRHLASKKRRVCLKGQRYLKRAL